MKKKKQFKPKTIAEGIEHLHAGLSAEEITYIKKNTPDSVHHTTGQSLRNEWGLWETNNPIAIECRKRFKLFGHADDLSGLVLAGLWAKIRNRDVDKTLQDESDKYIKHWQEQGVNPKTGKKIKQQQQKK